MSFSKYAMLGVLPWLLASPFQYGFAISGLNQIQSAMTCTLHGAGNYGLSLCIPMTDTSFSLITSIFTVGGLLASLVANEVIDPYGRRVSVQTTALFSIAGNLLMAIAGSVLTLIIGRFFIGLGSGLALCVIPPFLAEISPKNIKGSVGVLNQFSIVVGILVTQVLGFYLASPGSWRTVFLVSLLLSVAQFAVGTRMIESPAWLSARGRSAEARATTALIWDGDAPNDDPDLEESLLRESAPASSHTQPPKDVVSVAECFKRPELRKPLLVVSLAMTAQQISGINAVMYYSTDILTRTLPQAAAYVSLAVTVVNVIMTFPPLVLIDRFGQKKLLRLSFVGALISLLVLGYSLNSGWTLSASVAILSFVSSFAIGLGPIPFVIIPDVSPLYAVSAMSSVALSLNWIVNFFVGLSFLPLRNLLTDPNGNGAGSVFYVFALLFSVTFYAFFRVF